jgi:Fe(3+) dicitrate transport protein
MNISFKPSFFRSSLLIATIFICSSATKSIASEKNPTPDYNKTVMERVMVIGSPERAQDITGSAQYVDKETLDRYNYTDINRVLRQVPGVNIQEEEGYGNRPNIGLRGGRSERSADITLMEDGVLIAPAPYASPSAYYFPRVNRMEAVEVRKGSSSIKFGPRTTSGAVNLISSSVPSKQEIEALAGYGTDKTKRLEAHYGNSVSLGSGNFGFVVDASRDSTDGFKDIDIVGGNSGYQIDDIMAKFKISTDPAADIYQSLELKLGVTSEDSDETYLGLTQADFDDDPYRRYAASQKDHMDANHRQVHLRHYVDFNSFDMTTTLYHNRFARNWYKLGSVTIGGTADDNTLGLSKALNDPTYLAALKGQTDLDGTDANNLTVRANSRDYYATGIQSDFSTDFSIADTEHQLEFGLRYHYDKEDRFQHEDKYSITDGVMTKTADGERGAAGDRHAIAKSTSFYILDEITTGSWTILPGLRYEHIDLERKDIRTPTENNNITVSEIIPGLGVSYAFDDNLSIFGGVHKGFAPPGPSKTDSDNEESINYELGLRHIAEDFAIEVAGFFHDYSNLIAKCTDSSGCNDLKKDDLYNGGEVEAYGIEFSVAYDAASALAGETDGVAVGYSIPLAFNYTYTSAEFKSDFNSDFDEWDSVKSGDELPYIPEHQFYVSAGIVYPQWQAHVGGKYVDEMRTKAGSGSVSSDGKTDSHFIVDLAGEYRISEGIRFFSTLDNVFDKEYVAARRPAGARPGKPFTALAGLKFKF